MAIDENTNRLEVKSNGLLPTEIKTSPSGIQKQYFNTDLNHTISLVAGYDGQNEHIAKVDATGKLMVNAGTTSLTEYEVHNVTVDSTTPSGTNVNFSQAVSSVDLHIEGNDVNVKLNITKTSTLGDTIKLPVGDVNIPFTTDGLALWCAVSGGTSTVQIVGWW